MAFQSQSSSESSSSSSLSSPFSGGGSSLFHFFLALPRPGVEGPGVEDPASLPSWGTIKDSEQESR